MELTRLEAQHIETLSNNTRIYLVEYLEAYLRELLAQYDILHNICGIISDVQDRMTGDLERNTYSKRFGKHEFPVYNYDHCPVSSENIAYIILNDYHDEVFECLRREIEKQGFTETQIFYFPNRETSYELEYRQEYENHPLEDIIIFRSGPHAGSYVKGMDYADNARALFEYMLAEGYNRKYQLVWLVKDPTEFQHIEKAYDNVHFLSFGWSVSEQKDQRDAYYRALCLAKYLFMTDAYGFARNCRGDQIRVQLWHGCGFKTRINFVRCEKRYEYMTVISDLYSNIHQKSYGLREDQLLVTGYPKNDWLFHPMVDWRIRLGVPEARHYIFWLPTFRTPVGQLSELNEQAIANQTGLPLIYNINELEALNSQLSEMDAILLVKLHPFQDVSRICKRVFSNIIIMDNDRLNDNGLSINQILGHADGLISDYSSAAVDYLLLDRPVAFTLDDVEEYSQSRGFHFDDVRAWMPGMELDSFDGFLGFIDDVINGVDKTCEKRRKIAKKMHRYFDGRSCERVLEQLGIVLE